MAASSDEESAPTPGTSSAIDTSRHRFPFCIVWTPIPLITWLFPFIGHMGIATSRGVIRDFAGPYFVSKDQMGFGWPTRFWQLDPAKASGGVDGWDHAVTDASEEYKSHMHNLFCDNCHSHVALTLNLMNYDGSNSWNMVKLAALIFFKGRVTGCGGWLKQWLPFLVLVSLVITVVVVTHLNS